MFTVLLMVNKMWKIVHYLYFCWWLQKISHTLGKIFYCIWKILFSSFRKCYGLLGSEVPLAKCQPLKIYDFGIFFLTQQFFWYFFPQHLTNVKSKAKPIKHIILWKILIKSFRSLKYFAQTVTNILLSSAENTKMSYFWNFNDRNSEGKYDKWGKYDPIFLMYPSSSIS